MIKKKNKRGFTVSELLIALGVIAILTAVLMPIIHSLIPDQNILMAKRSFYTAEAVVGNIMNDKGCYPPIRHYAGFEDGTGYTKCPEWNKSKGNSTPANAASKFATLFLERFDKKGGVTQTSTGYKFTTKDGVDWEIKSIDFSAGGSTGAVITVDVNGSQREPNCGQVETSTKCEKINDVERTKGFDKYSMTIQPNGKIVIHDCWAIRSVRTDKKLVGGEDGDLNCN